MEGENTDDLISSCVGRPPEGCMYCDRGAKMVFLITGLCSRRCFYCPLSEKKKDIDVIFANERRVEGDNWMEQACEEVKRMDGLGTGITGGDPLIVPERTIEAILHLKREFGPKHHIHLYTSAPFENRLLGILKGSGLDEIRFHPPLELWDRFSKAGSDSSDERVEKYVSLIEESMELGLRTGLEVPAVPDVPGCDDHSKGLFHLLEWAAGKGLHFVNVNELEASHSNMGEFAARGYELLGDSMAVMGSRELSWKAIGHALGSNPDTRTVFHFCSSQYKDAVQLRNRLKRTSKVVSRPYDIVTEDGTLIRGVISSDDPSALEARLHEIYQIPAELMEVAEGKLLIASWVLEDISEDIQKECFISEIYPTWDGLEVERIPL